MSDDLEKIHDSMEKIAQYGDDYRKRISDLEGQLAEAKEQRAADLLWSKNMRQSYEDELAKLKEEVLTAHESARKAFLFGIITVCNSCGGRGRKAYGSCSTWRGGISGQAVTTDTCDKCWGSGDLDRKGTDLRKMWNEYKVDKSKIKKLERQLAKAKADGEIIGRKELAKEIEFKFLQPFLEGEQDKSLEWACDKILSFVQPIWLRK